MDDTTKLQSTVDLLDKAMSELSKLKKYKNNWNKEKTQTLRIKKESFVIFNTRKEQLNLTASKFVDYLLKTETKYLENEAQDEAK
jgi:hypothetical protein